MGLGHATLPWPCPSRSWVSLNVLKQGAPSRGLIIRDKSFPRQHPQDSYNEPQVTTLSTMRSVVPAILPCDPLFVFVLQCLVRSCMDHGAESHRVRSAVSVESKYGQWRPSHARAWDTSLFHSRISLVSFMTTRSVHALEDHVAWSSRTSLVTLMSAARASS